jgi:hypothetical protein
MNRLGFIWNCTHLCQNAAHESIVVTQFSLGTRPIQFSRTHLAAVAKSGGVIHKNFLGPNFPLFLKFQITYFFVSKRHPAKKCQNDCDLRDLLRIKESKITKLKQVNDDLKCLDS